MRLPRLLIALAVAGVFLSPAYAHAPLPAGAGTPKIWGAVREVVQDASAADIIPWSEWGAGRVLTRRVAVGTALRWAGVIGLASTVVLGGLQWFYDQAKRSTGTSLDDWWNSAGPYSDWMWLITGGYCDSAINMYVWRYTCPNCPNYTVRAGTCSPVSVASAETAIINQHGPLDGYSWVDGPVQVIPPGGGSPWSGEAAYVRSSRPPLPDWLQSHPDAVDGLKRALDDYLADLEQSGVVPQTFGEPAPGVTLDPAPTGNQWWDNPFFNPYEDTDGDGWPDWFEWDTGSDPTNAGSQPLPTADPDQDGYDNASERDAGTDPTDPSSRPDVSQDQDADGDGLRDSADPCPSDPNNQCQPQDENPDDMPSPSDPALTPVDLPQFEHPELPSLTGRFDQVRTNFEQNLQTLWDTLQDRFPVGMARWIPAPPSVGGSCQMQFQLEIPGLAPATVDICNTPAVQWAASTGRRIVLASLMVGFLFAVARRASHA